MDPEVADIDLNDPELEKAATKIQATFKGFKARRQEREDGDAATKELGSAATAQPPKEDPVDETVREPVSIIFLFLLPDNTLQMTRMIEDSSARSLCVHDVCPRLLCMALFLCDSSVSPTLFPSSCDPLAGRLFPALHPCIRLLLCLTG